MIFGVVIVVFLLPLQRSKIQMWYDTADKMSAVFVSIHINKKNGIINTAPCRGVETPTELCI